MGLGAAAVSLAGTIGAATYFARRVLTPDRLKPDDMQIFDVSEGAVTLELNEDSRQPGRYGLWFDDGRGHARVGAVLSLDQEAGRVRRVLEGVDAGELAVGPARWNQYYFIGSSHGALGDSSHGALGLPLRDVEITSEIGMLAAWEVPADLDAASAAGESREPGEQGKPGEPTSLASDPVSARWAVLMHGRGGTREECLRAVPVLHELGFTSLIPMYRNDLGAPSSSDGRYSLGLSEWRDCEAAILYAVEAGAQEVVLFGWSMGGAIILQTLDRSWLSDRVTSVVLDAPVIDWADVLRHHGALHKIPAPVGSLSRSLIGRRWARRLVGVHEPIDVALTNWEQRSDELKHRTLLIHSLDDEFVPAAPSVLLATKRPDLIRFEPWKGARHTKEWNTEPGRWDAVVRDFLRVGRGSFLG
jgi:pimeloyl-ACP methyl ester carboxylesterase